MNQSTDSEPFTWPGNAACAVSLTYDDGVPIHREAVAPLMASKGLFGTFYPNATRKLTDEIDGWREVAAMGHELGNHSLFHPCRREPPERYEWLAPEYDLCDYTEKRWLDEMRIANCILGLIDGRAERTFGNTCCNTTLGRGEAEQELAPLILQLFAAGRGACNSRIVDPVNANLGALGHCNGDRRTSGELASEVEQAAASHGWMIFMMHGVGKGTHGLFIEKEEHHAFLDFLEANATRIWTAPMVEIAQYVRGRRGGEME